MKKITALAALLLLGCAPAKTIDRPNNVSLASTCPKKTACTIELHPDKGMKVENTDSGYKYTLEHKPGSQVIVYKHTKQVAGNLQDASNRVEIIFEYNGMRGFSLKDEQLESTKMLYGRFCYCTDGIGYFPVKRGQLSIDATGHAQLDLTVTEVPQTIKQLQFDLK